MNKTIVAGKTSMLSLNLAKSLLEEQAKSNRQLDSQIAQTSAQLEEIEELLVAKQNVAESLRSLQNYGFADSISAKEKEKAQLIAELAAVKLERATEGEFSIEEIKRVAIKYNLRFLHAAFYRGDLPDDLLQKIQRIEEKYTVGNESQLKLEYPVRRSNDGTPVLSSGWEEKVVERERLRYSKRREPNPSYDPSTMPYSRATRERDVVEYYKRGIDLYILAPKESFQLQLRPKDPICFAALKNGKYAFVHKWGDDLSLSRSLTYWRWRSKGHDNFVVAGNWLLWGGIAGWALFVQSFFGWQPSCWQIAGIVVSSLVGLIYFGCCGPIDENSTSNKVWNSPFAN